MDHFSIIIMIPQMNDPMGLYGIYTAAHKAQRRMGIGKHKNDHNVIHPVIDTKSISLWCKYIISLGRIPVTTAFSFALFLLPVHILP